MDAPVFDYAFNSRLYQPSVQTKPCPIGQGTGPIVTEIISDDQKCSIDVSIKANLVRECIDVLRRMQDAQNKRSQDIIIRNRSQAMNYWMAQGIF
jgi:hypothetical protein